MITEEDRFDIREAWRAFVRSRFEGHAFPMSGHRNTCEHIEMADFELDALQEQIAYAKQRRNRAVGPCSLPPEILSAIFLLSRNGWDPCGIATGPEPSVDNDTSASIRTSYTLGWMGILRTCSSWRQTALSTPALWTELRCLGVHPQSVPTLLARSRLLPLSLIVDGSALLTHNETPSISTGGWLSMSTLRCTQSLSLTSIPNTRLRTWIEALCHPMPRLEDIHICGRPPKESEEAGVILTAEIFAHNAPALKHVHLVNVGFPWDCALFSSNITTLILTFDEIPLDNQAILDSTPSAEQFSNALSSMVALRELTLRSVFPDLPEDTTNSYTVALPSGFRKLCLTAEHELLEPGLDLLQHLEFPAETEILMDIWAFQDGDIQDDVITLIPRLFGVIDEVTPRELWLSRQSLSMQYRERPQQDIVAGKLPGSFDPWSEFNLTIGGRGLFLTHGVVTELPPLISYLPALPLHTLHTLLCAADTVCFFTSPGIWLSTFALSPDVRNISIQYGRSAYHLLEALGEADNEDNFLLFPHLTTLALHESPESEGDLEPNADSVNLRSALEVAISYLLQLRRERDSAVKELLVARSMLEWDVWSRIKEFTHVVFF